ncbi:hypothetical protein LCGC14_1672050 [marine sediment metagenome]|uniref:Uncharacterized protein n=1 Tax=marine sediment metagenome TaxID=412755 RepID=A0A0F9HRR0_9ZZZZ
MTKHRKKQSNTEGSIRIIGGTLRGRKISFPNIQGLRPTGDRIRETLFNWLQPDIGDSRCLDLFSGSGALGFESASRGAAEVVMVESDSHAYMQLKQQAELLKTSVCKLHHQTAQQFISSAQGHFDIVYIDPPFSAQLWASIADSLVLQSLLRAGAKIYLEQPRQMAIDTLPPSWFLLKEKQAGDVIYCLFEYQPGAKS